MTFVPDPSNQIDVINPKEAALRQATGFLANGQTAPPVAMVDTAPGAPSIAVPKTAAALKFVPDAPPAKPDAIGEANKAAEQGEHGPVQDVIDMMHSAVTSIGPQLKNLVTHGVDPDAVIDQVAHGLRTFLQNPETATPQVVGANVVAPALLGEGAGLLGRGAEAAMAPAAEAGPAAQLGLRTAGGIPAKMAGNTAGPTLDIQNQRVGSSVLGADAGVPHSSPVTAETLATAREAPGRVLDQGAASLPTGPLSPAAQAQVAAARGPATITKPTPNVTGQINNLESSLLDPSGQFTGDQIRATRNSLSSDAQAGRNSADADTRAIAAYKGRLVNALDQHVDDTLPADAPVSVDQVVNARQTLAKNYQLQDLIGKGGDINLQALAKLHRDNPNLLTGNTRTVAQFASDHPEVTGGISDANRISPPGLTNDLSSVNVVNPRTWVQPLFGALGRRLLTGPNGEAVGSAMQAPVAGLAGEFDTRPQTPNPLAPQPPAPLSAGPMGAPAAPAPPPGQISLADLLSHGVEQSPTPGLSLASEGAAPASGVPFQRNAAHEAGGLSLDELLGGPRTYGGQPPSDLPGVMSANVPEGTMSRTGRPNNASSPTNPVSLEGEAARTEALTQGVQPVSFGADDQAHPMSVHDIQRRDLNPAPDSIFIDAKNGTIINSGNMAPRAAQALLARWRAIHGGSGSLAGAF